MANIDTSFLERIIPLLHRSDNDDRPVVLMTCGMAGSGKTTLVKAVIKELPHFTRLSIDEIIFQNHGLYGVDYPADNELHGRYMDEADAIYLENFHQLLKERKDIVVEKSLYAKEHRDEFKKAVEQGGGRWVLVYLKVDDKEALWNRICERSAKERNANSAFDITREIFDGYWAGFDWPHDEGEVVLDVFVHGTSSNTD